MNKKCIIACLVLPIIAVAVLVNFNIDAYAANKVVKIRLCSQMPVGHYNTVALDNFIKDAEKRSGGSLKFTHFPAGQLYKPEALVEVLPAGGVEMAQIAMDRHSGRIPVGNFASVPLQGFEQFYRWYYDTADGGGIHYEILQPEFAKDNMHLISTLLNTSDFAIITNKPVKKVADYKGLKIRASGRGLGAAVRSWGASAVVMSSSDVYLAIQRGTIDGAMSGHTSLTSRKWYEIANYVQDMDLGVFGFSLAANLKFWKSLAPDQKKAIEEAARATEIWLVDTALKGEVDSTDIMRKAGVEVWDWPAAEHKKLKDLSNVGIAKVIKPDVGAALWNKAVNLMNNVKTATIPWKELLEKRKF